MTKAGKRIIKAMQELKDFMDGKGPPIRAYNAKTGEHYLVRYKPRIVPDKTKYNRKDKNGVDIEE